MAPKTFVYVDGFNLYYRALRNTQHRWLNLKTLFDRVLPNHDIARVKYYTANVSGRPDPDAPRRQHLYLKALATVPEIEIYKGNFLSTKKWARLASNPPKFRPPPTTFSVSPMPQVVWIHKTEEKGSDVNLGVHLVHDAWRGQFDEAFVVSNDTDLVEPIRIVVQELGKKVGAIFPVASPAESLIKVASSAAILQSAQLQASQFTDPVVDRRGNIIQKPSTW